ncbi:MAG: hypothetical protein IJ530_07090 [Treponema sp.]|uniref:hypothetical protein n=1 Tax=Treponema sp. TaxID=166 RepID=UPI0025CC8275|nr:hypothetical protein [Treponema sp.]MBQ8679512.1 hypothetical protein [Treponema sp.]
MESSEEIEKILPAFAQYYTVKKEDDLSDSPFCAEAEFRSHNEQYFLVRSAHIADIDSNEFVYFAKCQELTLQKLAELSEKAWLMGLEKVHPYNGHRNSDVVLLIFTDSLLEESARAIKKTKFYKSYKFSFYGWSNFKLAVCDLSTLELYSNRQGKDFAKLIEKNLLG